MSKTLLLLLLLALLGLFVLAGCVIQKDIVEPLPDTNTSLSDRELSDKEQCESQGRIWFNEVCIEKSEKCENAGGQLRMFGDGCGDSCGVKPRLCTQALQAGCDCGATQCYDVGLIAQNVCCKTFNEKVGETEFFWSSSELCSNREGVSCAGSCPSPTDGVECSGIKKIVKCVADPYEPYATSQEACENTNGNWDIVLPTSECKTNGDCGVMCFTTPCPQPICFDGQCISESQLEESQTNCPQFMMPPLCEDGELVSGGFNEKTGCRNHPQCVRPTCQCPEGEVFTTQGCIVRQNNLMSIIAYGR